MVAALACLAIRRRRRSVCRILLFRGSRAKYDSRCALFQQREPNLVVALKLLDDDCVFVRRGLTAEERAMAKDDVGLHRSGNNRAASTCEEIPDTRPYQHDGQRRDWIGLTD